MAMTEADIRAIISETAAEKGTEMLTEATNVVLGKSTAEAELLPDKHLDTMRKQFEIEDEKEALESNVGHLDTMRKQFEIEGEKEALESNVGMTKGQNFYESPSLAKVAGEQKISSWEHNEAAAVLNETESKFQESSLGKEMKDDHVQTISTIKGSSAEEIQQISIDTLSDCNKDLNGRIPPEDNAGSQGAHSGQSAEGEVHETNLAEEVKVDITEKIPTIQPASSKEDVHETTLSEEGLHHRISESVDKKEAEMPFKSEGTEKDLEEMMLRVDTKDEDTKKETAERHVITSKENPSDQTEEATNIGENAHIKLGSSLTVTPVEETCLSQVGSDDIHSEAIRSSDHLADKHITEAETSRDSNAHSSITNRSLSQNDRNEKEEIERSKNELLESSVISDVDSNKDGKLEEDTNSRIEMKIQDARELNKNISSEECEIQSTDKTGYSSTESKDVPFRKVVQPLLSSTAVPENVSFNQNVTEETNTEPDSTAELNEEEDVNVLCSTAQDRKSARLLVEETKQEQVCEENQGPIKEPTLTADAYVANSIAESSTFGQTLAEGASDMYLTSSSQIDADELETKTKVNSTEKLQINAEKNTENKLQQHGEASEEQDHGTANPIKNTVHGSETTFDGSSVTSSEEACLRKEESSTPELRLKSLAETQDESRIEAKEEKYVAEESSEVQPQQSVNEIQFSGSQSVENDGSMENGVEKTFTDDHSLSSESSKKDVDDLATSHFKDTEVIPVKVDKEYNEGSHVESEKSERMHESVTDIQYSVVPYEVERSGTEEESLEAATTETGVGEFQNEGTNEGKESTDNYEKLMDGDSHLDPAEKEINQEELPSATIHATSETTNTGNKSEVRMDQEVISPEVVNLQHDKDRGVEDQEYSVEKKSEAENANTSDSFVADIPGAKGLTDKLVPEAEHEGLLQESTKDSEIKEKSSIAVEGNKETAIAADDNTSESLMDHGKPNIRPVETAHEKNEDSRGFSSENKEDKEDEPEALSLHGGFEENRSIQEEEHQEQHSFIGTGRMEDDSRANDEGSNEKEDNEDQEADTTRGVGTKQDDAESQSVITEEEDWKIHRPDVNLETLSPPEELSTDISHDDEPLDLSKPADIASETIQLNKASVAMKEKDNPEEPQPTEGKDVKIPIAGIDAQLLQNDPTVTTLQDQMQKLENENDPNAAEEAAKVESERKGESDKPKEMEQEFVSIEPAKDSISNLMQESVNETISVAEEINQLAEDHVCECVEDSNKGIVQKENQVGLSDKNMTAEINHNSSFAVSGNKIPVQKDPKESSEPVISSIGEDIPQLQPVSVTISRDMEELEQANDSEDVAETKRVERVDGTGGESGEKKGNIDDDNQIPESSQEKAALENFQTEGEIPRSAESSQEEVKSEEQRISADIKEVTGNSLPTEITNTPASEEENLQTAEHLSERSKRTAKKEEVQTENAEIAEDKGVTTIGAKDEEEEEKAQRGERSESEVPLIIEKDTKDLTSNKCIAPEMKYGSSIAIPDKKIPMQGDPDESIGTVIPGEIDKLKQADASEAAGSNKDKEAKENNEDKATVATRGGETEKDETEIQEPTTENDPNVSRSCAEPSYGKTKSEEEQRLTDEIEAATKNSLPTDTPNTSTFEEETLQKAKDLIEENKLIEKEEQLQTENAERVEVNEVKSNEAKDEEEEEEVQKGEKSGSEVPLVVEKGSIDPRNKTIMPTEMKEYSSTFVPDEKIQVQGDVEESTEKLISSEDKDIQPGIVPRTVELVTDEPKHVDASKAPDSNKDDEAKEKNEDQATDGTNGTETRLDEGSLQEHSGQNSRAEGEDQKIHDADAKLESLSPSEKSSTDICKIDEPLNPSKPNEVSPDMVVQNEVPFSTNEVGIPEEPQSSKGNMDTVTSADRDVEDPAITPALDEIQKLKTENDPNTAPSSLEPCSEKAKGEEEQRLNDAIEEAIGASQPAETAITTTFDEETLQIANNSSEKRKLPVKEEELQTENADKEVKSNEAKYEEEEGKVQKGQDLDSEVPPWAEKDTVDEINSLKEEKEDSSSVVPDDKIPVQGDPEESTETVIFSKDKHIQPVSVTRTVELKKDEVKHVDASEAGGSNKDEESKEKNEDQATVATNGTKTSWDEASGQSAMAEGEDQKIHDPDAKLDISTPSEKSSTDIGHVDKALNLSEPTEVAQDITAQNEVSLSTKETGVPEEPESSNSTVVTVTSADRDVELLQKDPAITAVQDETQKPKTENDPSAAPSCHEPRSEKANGEEEQRLTDEIGAATRSLQPIKTANATTFDVETLQIAENSSEESKIAVKEEELQTENEERAEDKEVKTNGAKYEEEEGELQKGEDSGSRVPFGVEKDTVNGTKNEIIPPTEMKQDTSNIVLDKKITVQGDAEESIEKVISSEEKVTQPVSVPRTIKLEIDELKHVDAHEAAASNKDEEAKEKNEDQTTVSTNGSETGWDEATGQSSISEGEKQKIHEPDAKTENSSGKSSIDICQIDEPLNLSKPTKVARDIIAQNEVPVSRKEVGIPEEPQPGESIVKEEELQPECVERAEDKEVKTNEDKYEEEVQKGDDSGCEVPSMVENDTVNGTKGEIISSTGTKEDSSGTIPDKKIPVQGDPEESIETMISSEDKDIQPVSVTGIVQLKVDEPKHVDASEGAGSSKDEEVKEENEDQATVATRASETERDKADSHSNITEWKNPKLHQPDLKLENLSPLEESSKDICHTDEHLDREKPTEKSPGVIEVTSSDSIEVKITNVGKEVQLQQKDPALTTVKDEIEKAISENDPGIASEAATMESEAKGAADEVKEIEQESTSTKPAMSSELDLMQGSANHNLSVADERETPDQLAGYHLDNHEKCSNIEIAHKEEQLDISSNKKESLEPVISSGDEDISRPQPVSETVEHEIEEELVNASKDIGKAETVERGDNAKTGECVEEKGTTDYTNQISRSIESTKSALTDLSGGSAKETIEEAEDINSQDQREDLNVVQHIQDSPIRTVHGTGVNDIEVTQKIEELEAAPLPSSQKDRELEADRGIVVDPNNSTGDKNVSQIQKEAAAKTFHAGEQIPRRAEPSHEGAKREEKQRTTDEIKESTGKSVPTETVNTSASKEEKQRMADVENAKSVEGKRLKADESKEEEEEGVVERGENSGCEVPLLVEKDKVDPNSNEIITVEKTDDSSSGVPDKKTPEQEDAEERIKTVISNEHKDIQPLSVTGPIELEKEELKHVNASEAAAEAKSLECEEEKTTTDEFKEISESSILMVSAKSWPSDLGQASKQENRGKAEKDEFQDTENHHVPPNAGGSTTETITKDGVDGIDSNQDKQEPETAPQLAPEENVGLEAHQKLIPGPENAQLQQQAAAEAAAENSSCREPDREPAKSKEEQRVSDEKEEKAMSKSLPTEADKESLEIAEQQSKEESKLVTEKDKVQAQKAEKVEDEAVKTDEEEEEEKHKGEKSGSEALVIVEASKDVDAKVTPKKSHNILSGVGSKVKHSIAKVKKAITGKHSHTKPPSPK